MPVGKEDRCGCFRTGRHIVPDQDDDVVEVGVVDRATGDDADATGQHFTVSCQLPSVISASIEGRPDKGLTLAPSDRSGAAFAFL